MSSWLIVQDRLVDIYDVIAKIDVETITFTRIGGYKSTPYSSTLDLFTQLSPKSLKGVWRWWARAAIVGAYKGSIGYREANEHLDMIFGGVGEGKGISSYTLRIEEISDEETFSARKREITKICKKLDTFYKSVRDFLQKQSQQQILPEKSEVSIRLNVVNPAVIIKNEEGRLNKNHLNIVHTLIMSGPLKEHCTSKPQLKREGKEIRVDLSITNSKMLNEYINIPRVRLLLMKRVGEEDTLTRDNFNKQEVQKSVTKYLERVKEEIAGLLTKGLRFRIWLSGSKDTLKVNFALSSLILSLIFGGVGSITRRGFGSLKLLSMMIKEDVKIDPELKNIIDRLQSSGLASEVKQILEELCKITINYAAKTFQIPVKKTQEIPKVPSLSNIKIEVIECVDFNFQKIGEVFLKQRWKRHPTEPGRELHTWILGLPRFQENTGYAVKRDNKYDPLRRLSSIGVRCFSNQDKSFLIIYGLLSDDWPKTLLHIRGKGHPHREKPVNQISDGGNLQKVFEGAFKNVLQRLR